MELLGPLAVVSNSSVSQNPWVMLRVPSALAFSAAGSTNPDGTFLSLAGTAPAVQFLLELANSTQVPVHGGAVRWVESRTAAG